jgi:hypothetical protein
MEESLKMDVVKLNDDVKETMNMIDAVHTECEVCLCLKHIIPCL